MIKATLRLEFPSAGYVTYLLGVALVGQVVVISRFIIVSLESDDASSGEIAPATQAAYVAAVHCYDTCVCTISSNCGRNRHKCI